MYRCVRWKIPTLYMTDHVLLFRPEGDGVFGLKIYVHAARPHYSLFIFWSGKKSELILEFSSSVVTLSPWDNHHHLFTSVHSSSLSKPGALLPTMHLDHQQLGQEAGCVTPEAANVACSLLHFYLCIYYLIMLCLFLDLIFESILISCLRAAENKNLFILFRQNQPVRDGYKPCKDQTVIKTVPVHPCSDDLMIHTSSPH